MIDGQEPPPWLDRIAQEHWLYFAPLLASQRLLSDIDLSLLAAASERWSVYRRASALLKRSVRSRKLTAGERLRLAEQAALKGAIMPKSRGVLRRGDAPSGNELPADTAVHLDPRLLGEFVVPPHHSIATQALQDYLSIMREFGVGPAVRARMKIEMEAPQTGDGDSDKITELRSRRQRRAASLD
jgi:phage terminase small subunit